MSEACPYCREGIAEFNRTECSSCRTPHHADCWQENGGCTIFGCKEAPADDPKIAIGSREAADAGAQYFLAREGVQTGPFDLAHLQQELTRGTTPPDTLAWKEGTTNWVPLSELLAVSPAGTGALGDVLASSAIDPNDPCPGVMRFGRAFYLLTIFGFGFVKGAFSVIPETTLIGVVLFYIGLFGAATLRTRDVGLNGWLVLLLFVPLANIWLGFHLLLAPRGFAITKKSDLAMKISVWVIIGFVVLMIIGAFLASFGR